MSKTVGTINNGIGDFGRLSGAQFTRLVMQEELKGALRKGVTYNELFNALKDAQRKNAKLENMIGRHRRVIDKQDKTIKRLQEEKEKLKSKVLADAFTGAGSQAKFDADFETAIADRLRDSSRESGILIIDGRGVKALNDTMGRNFGDVAIKRLADAIGKTIRKNEHFYRLNGGADEFAVIIDNSDEKAVENFIKRLEGILSRLNMNEKPIVKYSDGCNRITEIKVGFSWGFCSTEPTSDERQSPRDAAGRSKILHMKERILRTAMDKLNEDKERYKNSTGAQPG